MFYIKLLFAGAVCVGAVFGVYIFIVWIMAILLMYLSIQQEASELITKNELTEHETVRVYALANMWKEWHYNIYDSDSAAAQRGLDLCRAHNIDLMRADVRSTTPAELKAAILFNTIDLNGNGDISVQELELFLVSFGIVNTSAAAKALFHNKKSVSLAEFTEHFAVFYEYAFSSLVYVNAAENTNPSLRNKLFAMAARDKSIASKCAVPHSNVKLDDEYTHVQDFHEENNTKMTPNAVPNSNDTVPPSLYIKSLKYQNGE